MNLFRKFLYLCLIIILFLIAISFGYSQDISLDSNAPELIVLIAIGFVIILLAISFKRVHSQEVVSMEDELKTKKSHFKNLDLSTKYEIDPHSFDHVFEEHDYDDVSEDKIVCPVCGSSGVVLQKSVEPLKSSLSKLLMNGLALALDGDLSFKDKYVCLDCNNTWER